MYQAADNGDVYLALMTAASCQEFYDYMYNHYNIDKIDLMSRIRVDNLALSAEAFDNALEEYKKNYDRLNVEIKRYKDLVEFERKYLG